MLARMNSPSCSNKCLAQSPSSVEQYTVIMGYSIQFDVHSSSVFVHFAVVSISSETRIPVHVFIDAASISCEKLVVQRGNKFDSKFPPGARSSSSSWNILLFANLLSTYGNSRCFDKVAFPLFARYVCSLCLLVNLEHGTNILLR